MNRLKDRIVTVTWGAMSIRKAAALKAASEGAKVAVRDVEDDEGLKVAQEITCNGGTGKYYHINVADEKEVKENFVKIVAEPGPIYGLVSNAGISVVNKPARLIEEAERDGVFAVNVKGVFSAPSMLYRL